MKAKFSGKAILGFVLISGLMTASCGKEDNIQKVIVPPDVQGITGIGTDYERGLHEYLEINPDVDLTNLTEENRDSVKYEWNIDYSVVSTDSVLAYKCDKLGSFNGFLKVSTSTGAKIADFKLTVTSPYDRGLLLLSSTADKGTIMTWKRLDKLETPASPYAFKDNNPTLELGKTPLDIVWRGETKTWVDGNPTGTDKTSDREIYVSTSDPVKLYNIDPYTMQVKREITYDGAGNFMPSRILCPYGWENSLFENTLAVFFVGDKKEYIMSGEYSFINSSETQPESTVEYADFATSVCTENSDMVRGYYDLNSKKLVYASGIMGEVYIGAHECNVTPIFLGNCDGMYRDDSSNQRYEPEHIILVGYEGASVKVIRTAPTDLAIDEEVLSNIDASGHITPESAIGVHPVDPVLYYSVGNKIYRLNYDGEQFDTEPYIVLDGNFAIKQMAFNLYDVNTLYIAAEDLDETGDKVASILGYDISDKNSARQLFRSDKVGGQVKKLIYKGNCREYQDRIKSGSVLSGILK